MNVIAFANRHAHKKPPRTKSGLKGVIYHPQCVHPWKAYIRHHGQYITIGYFDTKEEAGAAYNEVAKRLKGEGTWLNPLPQTR